MESIDAMLHAVNRKGCVAQLFIKEDGSEGYKIFKNEQESHNQVKGGFFKRSFNALKNKLKGNEKISISRQSMNDPSKLQEIGEISLNAGGIENRFSSPVESFTFSDTGLAMMNKKDMEDIARIGKMEQCAPQYSPMEKNRINNFLSGVALNGYTVDYADEKGQVVPCKGMDNESIMKMMNGQEARFLIKDQYGYSGGFASMKPEGGNSDGSNLFQKTIEGQGHYNGAVKELVDNSAYNDGISPEGRDVKNESEVEQKQDNVENEQQSKKTFDFSM